MICLKRPAMKSIRQKQIVNQFLVLELIITVFLLGIFVGGRSAVGHPERWMSFCKGHSEEMEQIILEATGISSWRIEFGKNIKTAFVLYIQFFILAEFFAYIFLLHHLYHYNENMKKEQLLGISNEILNGRHKKNVITFFGQFVLFLTQMISSVIWQFGHWEVYQDVLFGKAIQTVVFILISPELRQFCFGKRN